MMRDSAVVVTLAEQLAARTGWSWNPAAPYAPSDIGIFYGAVGSSPDTAVGITLYTGDDSVITGLAIRRVQFLFRGPRGDRAGADDMADEAFTALQGMVRIGGLSLVSRVLVANLGTDENTRQERADSYQIIIDNPEATP
jgi:hypothetical protein